MSETKFMIEHIFAKNVSFESPHTPAVFQIDWKPEADIELNTETNKLGDDRFDVTLRITVTAKCEDKTCFLVELKHAGVFVISGIPDDQMDQLLGSYCPSILFPYAKEYLSGLVSRGGFPQLNLAPVNFEMLYQQKLTQQAQSKTKH